MKKSKKFVLAALALLAITGLLALTGCKNDSVPPEVEKQEQTNDTNDTTNTEDNTSGGSDSGTGGGDTGDSTSGGNGGGSETDKNNTAAKLVSISVTTLPERTVYSVGQEFDHTDMVVTATYEGGEKQEVTGWTTNFNTVVTEKGLAKTVTVSYTEGGITREDTFTVDVASYQFTETVQDVDPSYTGTRTAGTYKKFGDWPQTIKEEDVEIGAGTLVRGGLTYYVGNDGNYYVEQKENAKESGTEYKYSNGDQAGQGGTSTKWFKVEPIVWRVLTEDYKAPDGKSTGNALLLAESILTGGIKWADSSNKYKESNIRKWLNGNRETGETSDYGGDAGFLQTAFTQSALGKIAPTTVDNSAASTTDKIFLLSHQEATNSEYGFAAPSTRIRVTTDYAKATGAYQGDSSAGSGGRWWLRSPISKAEDLARGIIGPDGNASDFPESLPFGVGVVPALSISLQ